MKKHKNAFNEHLEIWMEEIRISVDEQEVTGVIFHIGSADINVQIQSPFAGFNEGAHKPHFARGIFPDGYNGEHGTEAGKAMLKQLYLDHKDYAESVKQKKSQTTQNE